MSYPIPTTTVTVTNSVTIAPKVDSTSSMLFKTAAGANFVILDSTNKYLAVGTPSVANATLTATRNSTTVTPVVPDSIHVVGADGANTRIQINTYGTGVSSGIVGYTATGTAASPGPVANGTAIFLLQGRGYLNTSFSNTADILYVSEENYTDATAKTGIVFRTTASGSTAASEKMRLDGSGHLGIGTSVPATSALVELSSTTGALLISRMTTAQRDALTAVNGMIIYNTTTSKFQAYEAGAWANII